MYKISKTRAKCLRPVRATTHRQISQVHSVPVTFSLNPKHRLLAGNILDALPASIVITQGPQHRIIMTNQRTGDAVNFDMIGYNWLDLIEKSRRFISWPLDIRAQVERAYTNGTSLIVDDLKELLTDGTNRFWKVEIQPLFNNQNYTEGLVIHAVDTTDLVQLRKQAEKVVWEKQVLLLQVEDQRRLFNAIVESIGAGLFLIGQDERVIYANQKINELLNLDQQSTIGQTFQMVLHQIGNNSLRPDQTFQHLETALAQPNEVAVVEISYSYNESDNKIYRDLQFAFFDVYDEKRRRVGRGCVIRDVTGEKEIERLKTQFISTVSHEMRTPLTGIYGYAELLLHRSASSTVQMNWVKLIYKEARNLNEIIDELLDLSRIEAGRLELIKSKFDLTKVAHQVLNNFERLVEQDGLLLALEIKTASDLPLIYADATKIQKVLNILLSNAVKYSPYGGVIKLIIEKDLSVGEVVVSVSDQGIGIEPREQQRIFERFYRTQQVQDLKINGSGLGLAIAKSIVDLHQGRIWLASQVSRGSTFYFSLPRSL